MPVNLIRTYTETPYRKKLPRLLQYILRNICPRPDPYDIRSADLFFQKIVVKGIGV